MDNDLIMRNLPIAVSTAFFVMLVIWERLAPRTNLPTSKGWYVRAAFLTLCQIGVSVAFGMVLVERFHVVSHTKDLPHYIDALTALPIYFVLTLFMYGWHRLRHVSPFVWRTNHQIHHSPSRIEAVTTFYMHPVEITMNALLTAVTTCVLFRESVEVNAWVSTYSALANLFFHTNIRTPHWLGYIVQRPEMHVLHHERNVHSRNYSDLPIWDLIFKTFENPSDVEGVACGFEEKEERAFGRMLAFKDVHAQKEQAKSDLPLAS